MSSVVSLLAKFDDAACISSESELSWPLRARLETKFSNVIRDSAILDYVTIFKIPGLLLNTTFKALACLYLSFCYSLIRKVSVLKVTIVLSSRVQEVISSS